MTTTYYTATSLDGFLATDDDSVDFLNQFPEPEDTFTPFLKTIDSIAMGSATYEFNLRYVKAGNPWPFAQPVWVFTSRTLPIPPGADVRFASDIQAAHAEMPGNVWVCGGGGLATQFHDAGLLDELVITVVSCTLGAGKPLFPAVAKFKLVSARSLGEGFVELRYK